MEEQLAQIKNRVGVWKRYKVENEKEYFRVIGHADLYEKMKDMEETRTHELNEKGFVQTYRRGTIVLVSVSTKEVTTLEISPGKTIEIQNSDIKNGSVEFEVNGVIRNHRQTYNGDEMVNRVEVTKGDDKAVSVSYYKRV